MDFKKEFTILAKKYNLNYQYQDFKNCSGRNWGVIRIVSKDQEHSISITKKQFQLMDKFLRDT